ncbi:MAG: hypothetical protein WCX77_02485 [Candidatus Paceibacterota bacterium]|jgi:hypothetical protein
MKRDQKGFTALLIVLSVLILAGSGAYAFRTAKQKIVPEPLQNEQNAIVQTEAGAIANGQVYRNEEYGFAFNKDVFDKQLTMKENQRCGIAVEDKCSVLAEFGYSASKDAIAKLTISVFLGNISDFIFQEQANASTYKFDSSKKKWFFNGDLREADRYAPKKLASDLEAYIFESSDGACFMRVIILPDPNKDNVVFA